MNLKKLCTLSIATISVASDILIVGTTILLAQSK